MISAGGAFLGGLRERFSLPRCLPRGPGLRLRPYSLQRWMKGHQAAVQAIRSCRGRRLYAMCKKASATLATTKGLSTAGRTAPDPKSVVEGKSVSVRVDLGGRRIITKKKKKKP